MRIARLSLMASLILAASYYSQDKPNIVLIFMDNFGVGLGYNHVSLDVDADGSEFKGALDWTYDGVLSKGKHSFGSVE